MKKLIYVIVFFSFFQNVYSQSSYGWTFLNPKPQGSTIVSSQFINSNTGYALCENSTILKTTNYSINFFNPTWNFYSVNYTPNFYGVKLWIKNNDFYIIGYSGKIIKSTNLGLTFVSQNSTITQNLIDIVFINDNTGYIAAAQNILKTTNGGTNWFINYSQLVNFYAIKFLNEQTGFAASDGGKIFRTSNAGLNWSAVQTSSMQNINSLTFVNSTTGYACGNLGALIKTINAGISWFNTGNAILGNMQEINFFNENTGFVLNSYNNINNFVTTTNGGANWSQSNIGSALNLQTTSIVGPNLSFAGGDYGLMLKGINLNWHETSSHNESMWNYNDMIFLDINTGYAVEDSGAVLKTSNGGLDWEYISTVPNMTYSKIEFLNESTGIVYGQNTQEQASVYRSSNYGHSWNEISLGSEQNLRNISFGNTFTGYLSGFNGLYKTTNNGINWVIIAPQHKNIKSLKFVNSNTGFIVNSNWDSIFKSIDGGNNWILIKHINDGINGKVYRASFLDENTSILPVGNFSGIRYVLRTFNGGISWDSIVTNSSVVDINSKFITPDKGFATTSRGPFFTVDGGANWTYIPYLLTDFYFNNNIATTDDIYFINENTGFIYGQLGLLIKTTNGGSVFINNNVENIPTTHMLFQNYPNPFNPATTISFYLKKSQFVKLKVYDISGREVANLINEFRNSGFNEIQFYPENLSSGIYFYQIETDDFKESKKMVLIK